MISAVNVEDAPGADTILFLLLYRQEKGHIRPHPLDVAIQLQPW